MWLQLIVLGVVDVTTARAQLATSMHSVPQQVRLWHIRSPCSSLQTTKALLVRELGLVLATCTTKILVYVPPGKSGATDTLALLYASILLSLPFHTFPGMLNQSSSCVV